MFGNAKDQKRRVYAAMVDVMDRGIGEVVTALEQNGLRENTLVFFLSDNGGPQPTKSQPGKWNGSSNRPCRGGKGDLYDGGVHVPFIASWPATIPSGQTFDPPVIALDIACTAVAVAGANAQTQSEMEGVNLIRFVTGAEQVPPHEELFWRGGDGKQWSVLSADGTKHLQGNAGKEPELYYLPDDVSEAHDLLADQPQRARELDAKRSKWNERNVPCRLLGYIDYHKKRDQFFLEAIPKEATDAGGTRRQVDAPRRQRRASERCGFRR